MTELLAITVLAAVLVGRETMHYFELKRRDLRDVQRDEREAELLNRIKPETAQPLTSRIEPDQPHVSMFSDDEWHKAREEAAWQR